MCADATAAAPRVALAGSYVDRMTIGIPEPTPASPAAADHTTVTRPQDPLPRTSGDADRPSSSSLRPTRTCQKNSGSTEAMSSPSPTTGK
jgi:hypothetical protein